MTRPAKAAPKKRQPKTPRLRAEEQLGIARRKFDRLDDQVSARTAELELLTQERAMAAARADYLSRHPDLQAPEDIPLPLDGES